MADIDADDILSGLKKLFKEVLPGLIGNGANTVMSWFSGPVGWLLNIFGIGDELKKTVTENLETMTNKALETAAPDLGTARKTVTANLDLNKVFKPITKAVGLDDAAAASIQAICADVTTPFLAQGIPPLDEGLPSAGQDAGKKIREAIIAKVAALLTARDAKLPADQRLSTTQRAQIADAVATQVSGLAQEPEGGYDLAKPPTTGIAGMLMGLQLKAGAKDFKEGSLKSTDIGLMIDLNALSVDIAKIKAPSLPNTTGGNDVANTTTPPGGKTKTNTQGV
jgi:hypothetical protein